MNPRDTFGDARFVADDPSLRQSIARAVEALYARQQSDGHWVFELEADATIPSEFVLLMHFLGDVDVPLQGKIARYLRRRQGAHGGWPLFHGGALDVSATVKAYFALKAAGDPASAPHMVRAREAILAVGGAERANVFTRIQLALFGEVPWSAVPLMPVEIMHLPRWFPFHLEKISYWSRTVITPLLVLMALKPQARSGPELTVRELFAEPPEQVRQWGGAPERTTLARLFRVVDGLLRLAEPMMPPKPRARAIDKAIDFIRPRLNGEEGLGGIYPAMAAATMMMDALGWPADDPSVAMARSALRRLVVERADEAYCQPCKSPIWDTVLAGHALLEAGEVDDDRIVAATDWIAGRQVMDVAGDWSLQRPEVRPGGWPFFYAADHYPDVDDSAVIVMALHRADPERYRKSIERGTEWILGLQSANGGWGAFDADNTALYLNSIPFADHGALLDPPTADVTARVLSMLAQLGYGRNHPAVAAGLHFLLGEQEADGAWFGRWGTNYIYGTWSALSALNALGHDEKNPAIRKAVAWLLACQRTDGGWGESGASYWPEGPRGEGPASTPTQTAWALLGLMAADEADNPAVARGVRYLLDHQSPDGLWDEEEYTAVGFPRVFYLRYHGYPAYFSLWAVARYRSLISSNSGRVAYGM